MVCAFERFKVKRPIGDAVRAIELHLFDQLSNLIKLSLQSLAQLGRRDMVRCWHLTCAALVILGWWCWSATGWAVPFFVCVHDIKCCGLQGIRV